MSQNKGRRGSSQCCPRLGPGRSLDTSSLRFQRDNRLHELYAPPSEGTSLPSASSPRYEVLATITQAIKIAREATQSIVLGIVRTFTGSTNPPLAARCGRQASTVLLEQPDPHTSRADRSSPVSWNPSLHPHCLPPFVYRQFVASYIQYANWDNLSSVPFLSKRGLLVGFEVGKRGFPFR